MKEQDRASMGRACPLLLALTVILLFSCRTVQAQAPGSFTKAVVADHIRKVEDGVDEFRKYLERRGEDAQNRAQTSSSSGTTRSRAGRTNAGNTEARKEQARRTKDELDDALGDSNRSTNRLRRKFDPSSKYMETKVQMENVMDDGRKINQIMVRGKYTARKPSGCGVFYGPQSMIWHAATVWHPWEYRIVCGAIGL